MMKISPNASNLTYRFTKNSVNFKADVVILPSAPRGDQPREDAFILERETEKIKKELQRRFPAKDDNIQIFLQPTGFRSHSDKKVYWNEIKAFLGYKDAERARRDMLQRDITPPNEDYVKLEPETIEKLKNNDPEMIKRTEKKFSFTSTNYLKDDIEPNIKLHFIDDIEELVKNELDCALTECDDTPFLPTTSPSDDKIDIMLFPWL